MPCVNYLDVQPWGKCLTHSAKVDFKATLIFNRKTKILIFYAVINLFNLMLWCIKAFLFSSEEGGIKLKFFFLLFELAMGWNRYFVFF
ncbi:hypothetical protein DMA11_18240 [Marinilabiliaceae bacterium JC017]|nr:hypothetical protein DMA11_18240 [Marinilabiliaceae bacterium JC017]